MKTPILHIALIALLLEGAEWAMPLDAQSIEQHVPVRPHESEDVNRANTVNDIDSRDVRIKEVGGVISLHGLLHKPPKAAVKDFDRGLKAWSKGRRAEALQYLAAAVRLDPDYLDAHAYLGQLRLKQGEPLPALEHLERALALEPNSDVLESNRAWALLSLRRAAEAERAARRAVELAPNSVNAHYMLGLALLQQSRATEETAKHLEIAVSKYPDARIGLTWVREQLSLTERR